MGRTAEGTDDEEKRKERERIMRLYVHLSCLSHSLIPPVPSPLRYAGHYGVSEWNERDTKGT